MNNAADRPDTLHTAIWTIRVTARTAGEAAMRAKQAAHAALPSAMRVAVLAEGDLVATTVDLSYGRVDSADVAPQVDAVNSVFTVIWTSAFPAASHVDAAERALRVVCGDSALGKAFVVLSDDATVSLIAPKCAA